MSERAIRDATAVFNRIREWSNGKTHYEGCQKDHLLCACADAIEDLSNCLAAAAAENSKLWAVVNAAQGMQYADAVAGAELWGNLQELLRECDTASGRRDE